MNHKLNALLLSLTILMFACSDEPAASMLAPESELFLSFADGPEVRCVSMVRLIGADFPVTAPSDAEALITISVRCEEPNAVSAFEWFGDSTTFRALLGPDASTSNGVTLGAGVVYETHAGAVVSRELRSFSLQHDDGQFQVSIGLGEARAWGGGGLSDEAPSATAQTRGNWARLECLEDGPSGMPTPAEASLTSPFCVKHVSEFMLTEFPRLLAP